MEFFDAVQSRHSIRRMRSDEVEQEKLTKILNAVNAAPSAGDLQGYEVVLVRDAAKRAALSAAAFGQTVLAQAPVIAVFCADHLMSASKYGKRGAELYSIQDATIAASYCELAATALGLATAWIGAFDPAAVASAIDAPEQVTPVAMIPIGYPDEEPKITPRRKLDDLVRQEKF